MILSRSNLNIFLSVVFLVVVIAVLSFVIVPAFAQESSSSQAQQYLNRRVEIWALFYRGMVAAFVVGAVVQGSIIYVAWRFREGHKKNRIPTQQGAGDYR
ncbi:MAG TPA: heme transporter CcmC [Nitrososphaeraceae archaeon]|nr:heme transporter CcmC [Nitrososphaeraceae archaeon]